MLYEDESVVRCLAISVIVWFRDSIFLEPDARSTNIVRLDMQFTVVREDIHCKPISWLFLLAPHDAFFSHPDFSS
jgi:hypothetical protein